MNDPGVTGSPDFDGLNRRQVAIVDLVGRLGFAATGQLVDHFGVTSQTIRRDIAMLCDRGLVSRFHGGAARGSTDIARSERAALAQGSQVASIRLAELVVEHVPDGASLFVNAGPVSGDLAEVLIASRRGLRIVTGSILVANTLRQNPTFDVKIAGGRVRRENGTVRGDEAAGFLSQFRVDISLIGAEAIDQDGSVLESDMHEIGMNELAVRNSGRVFLIVGSAAFGRAVHRRLTGLAEISLIFADRRPDEAYVRMIEGFGTGLHVAA